MSKYRHIKLGIGKWQNLKNSLAIIIGIQNYIDQKFQESLKELSKP